MKVLFVTAEIAPFAKVGGLADVAGSLPRALIDAGCEVVLFCPAYGLITKSELAQTKPLIEPFYVRVNSSRFVAGSVYETEYNGLRIWSVDAPSTNFGRVEVSENIYSFQRDDYLFLAQAALETCQELGWIPDVIHCHDWHTGFLPPILRNSRTGPWERVGAVFTIHNLAYQGEFGFETLDAAGLPHWLYHPDYCEAYGAVNFLKSGAAFADRINTVSPTYAQEIQTPEYGARLDGFMRHLADQGRLSGILNGIDTEVWNPATDPAIIANYDLSDLSGKAECRRDLISIADLGEITGPIFGMVTRLSRQKGFDLLLPSIEEIIQGGAALVVQGLGDSGIIQELRRQEARYPGRVRLMERFDSDIAQKVYAGSDAFLMPSRFEPCGLGQMFAMRYGTVPVVRATGGLADTVFEGENGFTFTDFDPAGLRAAIRRACEAFGDVSQWRSLIEAGMAADHSWNRSAAKYVALYKAAVQSRRTGQQRSG